MAEHFLDTETRHEIPLTAMACIRAGLSTEQARDVWRSEVSPAVAFNMWDVAGEWAGWDQDWLVDRIERLRARRTKQSATSRWLHDRAYGHILRGVWVAIERCMDALLAAPLGDREPMARDLVALARHYFDFVPADFATLATAERQRICSRYPEPFQPVMAPALTFGEASAAERRVRAALERA